MKAVIEKVLGLCGVLLLGGFFWLGVPRCSEIDTLAKDERLYQDILCRRVKAEYFFEPDRGKLTKDEWRAAIRAYRGADVDDADVVIRRLVERLRPR